jgi:hypothetical protein
MHARAPDAPPAAGPQRCHQRLQRRRSRARAHLEPQHLGSLHNMTTELLGLPGLPGAGIACVCAFKGLLPSAGCCGRGCGGRRGQHVP